MQKSLTGKCFSDFNAGNIGKFPVLWGIFDDAGTNCVTVILFHIKQISGWKFSSA